MTSDSSPAQPRAHLSDQVAQPRRHPRSGVPASQLESLALVDSPQGSGVFVRAAGFSPLNFDAANAVSKQAVVQRVEVRRALEAEVAALAARHRRVADLKRIRPAVRALSRAVTACGDGVEEDVSVHCAIAEAAGN